SGWLGANQRNYLGDIRKKLEQAGLGADVVHVECPDHASKVRFMQGCDVLSVPTTYREPKGIYILEALANGVPVVQPRHGSFPELIEATGGGLLVEPESPQALADGLHKMLADTALRRECGQKGQAVIRERFTAERMASATLEVLKQYVR